MSLSCKNTMALKQPSHPGRQLSGILRATSNSPSFFCNTHKQIELSSQRRSYLTKANQSSTKGSLEQDNVELRRKLHELNSLVSLKLQSRRKESYGSKSIKVIRKQLENAAQTLKIMEKDKDYFEKRLQRIWNPQYFNELEMNLLKKQEDIRDLSRTVSEPKRTSKPAQHRLGQLMTAKRYCIERIDQLLQSDVASKIQEYNERHQVLIRKCQALKIQAGLDSVHDDSIIDKVNDKAGLLLKRGAELERYQTRQNTKIRQLVDEIKAFKHQEQKLSSELDSRTREAQALKQTVEALSQGSQTRGSLTPKTGKLTPVRTGSLKKQVGKNQMFSEKIRRFFQD